jgi:hypothetical protein
MRIVPADAASEDVWTFLSVVVLPEIGPWRFPERAEERLLGRPRNVLRRLWWRAWAVGPDLDIAPTGCAPLGEDEFVGIMERPSIGGNPRVACAVRNALWRVEARRIPIARSEVARELTRRFRSHLSHICVEALSDDELRDLLDESAESAVMALQGGSRTDAGRPVVADSRLDDDDLAAPEARPSNDVRIHASYKGELTEALFNLDNATVEILSGALAGRVFDRPSPAARAVVEQHSPDVNAARNGWEFWTVSSTGLPLQSLR